MKNNIDTQIKELLQKSVLINQNQKRLIVESLNNKTIKQKENLIKLFTTEHTEIKSLINNYLKLNGKLGAETLKFKTKKIKTKIYTQKENLQKNEEEIKISSLLKELNKNDIK